MREASWPLLRTEFKLSYAAVGLLLSAPVFVGAAIDPLFGLLSDTGRRRRFVLGGGVAFAAGLVLAACATGFLTLLAGFLLLSLASGSFVGLSQATLMDLEPERHELNMTRWEFAGAIGVVLGPLSLTGAIALGLGWRPLMFALAAATIPLVFVARAVPATQAETRSLGGALRTTLTALRRPRVLRWLVLLELTDLLGDIFLGFLALYLVDVAHIDPALAVAGVALWSVAGLAGDALLLALLRRISGVVYLRGTAALAVIVFPAFLLVPGALPKLALATLLGLLHAGWYALPQGRLFSELPGASGAAYALVNVSAVVGRLTPLLIGMAAERFGLGFALWLLLGAPLALLLLLPWRDERPAE